MIFSIFHDDKTSSGGVKGWYKNIENNVEKLWLYLKCNSSLELIKFSGCFSKYRVHQNFLINLSLSPSLSSSSIFFFYTQHYILYALLELNGWWNLFRAEHVYCPFTCRGCTVTYFPSPFSILHSSSFLSRLLGSSSLTNNATSLAFSLSLALVLSSSFAFQANF